MSAWDFLLAKSDLTIGTAWQHLVSALKLGPVFIVNDGIDVAVENLDIEVDLQDTDIVAEITEI